MRLIRRCLLPTGSAVLVGLAASVAIPAPARAAGPLGGAFVAPADAAAEVQPQFGLHLAVGDTRVYRISSKGSVDVDYGVIAAALTAGLSSASAVSTAASRMVTAQYDLGASLHWRVVAQDAKGYTLAARLQGAVAKIDDTVDPRRALLEAPFVMRLSPDGALQSLTFARGLPLDLQATIRGLVEPLQVVYPAAPSASWESYESGAGGAYDAAYRLGGAALPNGKLSLTKTKTRIYAAPLADLHQLPAGGSTGIGKADATLALDPAHGTIEHIDAIEDTWTEAGDTFISAHTGRYTAERINAPVATLAGTAAEAAQALENDSIARGRLYAVDARIAPRVQGLKLAGMLAAFDAELTKNQASAHLLLKSFLRLSPSESLPLARALDARQTATDDPAVVIGFAALAAAGHHEAQQALVEVLNGASWSARSKERALISMMDLELPEPAVLSAVWSYRNAVGAKDAGASVMQSIATNVYGALGDVAHGDATTTDTVVSVLASHLRSARDARQRVLALDALTNVGDFARVAPLAAPYFASAEPSVRVAAFVTFRRMSGEAAFEQFASRFAAEGDLKVQQEAARVAREMPESAARNAWAQGMAIQASDREVLMAVVQILGRSLSTYPENEATLRGLLETNHDRQVRRDVYAFVAPVQDGGVR